MAMNFEMNFFFVKFRSDTFFSTYIHFIIDEESAIQEMSPTAIKFFGIELKHISSNKKVLLSSFIKDVINVPDKSEITISITVDKVQ